MSIKLETWRELYSAAIKLDGLAPWKRIQDFNIFALEGSKSKELGFCNFKGRNNDYHTFFVYPDLVGLNNFYDFIHFNGNYVNHMYFRQKGLQVAYLNRSALGKDELNIIKKLGLNFRGKNSWPVFLKYESEVLPHPLETEQDAHYFIDALELATEVALNLEKYEAKLTAKDEMYLTFKRIKKDKAQQWQSKLVDLSNAFNNPNFPKMPFNQIKLELLAQTLPQTDDSWIADYMLLPIPVLEPDINRNPFFLRGFMVVDEMSEIILHQRNFNKSEYAAGIANEFLNAIESIGSVPESLTVTNVDTWHYLEPLTERLEIDAFFEPEIPALDSIFSEMEKFQNEKHKKEY